MMTDDSGRLLVLGGHGNRGSFLTTGSAIRASTTYANSDGWFDDISDGPVMARLVMYGGARRAAALHRRRVSGLGARRLSRATRPEMLDMITLDDVVEDMVDPRVRLPHRHVWHGRHVRRAAADRSDRHAGPAPLEGRAGGVEPGLSAVVLARHLADPVPRRRILLFRQHPAAVELPAQPVEPGHVRSLSPRASRRGSHRVRWRARKAAPGTIMCRAAARGGGRAEPDAARRDAGAGRSGRCAWSARPAPRSRRQRRPSPPRSARPATARRRAAMPRAGESFRRQRNGADLPMPQARSGIRRGGRRRDRAHRRGRRAAAEADAEARPILVAAGTARTGPHDRSRRADRSSAAPAGLRISLGPAARASR